MTKQSNSTREKHLLLSAGELALISDWSKLQAPFWFCPVDPTILLLLVLPHSLTFFYLHASLLSSWLESICTWSLFLEMQVSLLGLDNGLCLYSCHCRFCVHTDFQLSDLALSKGHISSGQLSWILPNPESHSHSWVSLGSLCSTMLNTLHR